MTDEQRQGDGEVGVLPEPRCLDCAGPLGEIDTVLTGSQWEMICPEGGELCANCINGRAARLPHVINLTTRITFVDDFASDAPGGKYFAFLKAEDAARAAWLATRTTETHDQPPHR